MNHLFYLLSEPMLIVESDESRWSIRDVNQAFAVFSGFKKSDLMLLDPSTINSVQDTALTFEQAIHQLTDELAVSSLLECKLVTKASTPADVRMSCRKLQLGERPVYVLICKDLREAKWIDEYILHNKIMVTSIVNERFNIMSLKHYYAPVQQPSSSYVNKSIFDLVAEHERNKLKRVLDFAKTNRTTETVDFQLKLGDRCYSTEAVIQPFYNGNRSFKNFVVVLTSLYANSKEEDPSYKLRMLMLSKNISVTSLAQSTLISLTTISKIRNGKIKKPQRLTAELIAGELGVRPEMIWSSFKR
ncbi:helix-turn-helix domain-containing protein [Paenibacillus sp. LHD-38]|uniref:helix-turn-helix domain-containing protein n=1 Tax=Paenibacillus sp. LHD-38 TaxID=3072143 RepID=UPI00281087BD|nr:helix-turn-helix domain-containing protein [Paenibacillus sp. LHD-38]MDQ8732974.1 helix-turn-helix domain-containing protein [Paenibacillus sp. LHD-38]